MITYASQCNFPTLPDDVWVGPILDFRKLVEPTTDGSFEGIFAGGSQLVGSAIGRLTGINYGVPTYANLYILVIGPTGTVRKSTVVSREHAVCGSAFTSDFVIVARSIGSGEALLELFCREEKDPKSGKASFEPIIGQRVLLDEPEFCNLLKKARRPGTANITEILLNLNDGIDFAPRTRSRSISVKQPFFSIITTSTPENLETSLNEVDIANGLIPRFANFYCNPRDPIAYPDVVNESHLSALATRLQDICGHARDLGARVGNLTLSQKARTEWERTFKDITETMRQERSAAAAIMARVPTMIMKWALIYSIQAYESEVSFESLARATLVGMYLMETARLVPQSVQRSAVAKIEYKIEATLEKAEGQYLTPNQIHRLVSGRIKAEELRRSLDSLTRLGVIREIEISGNKRAYGLPEVLDVCVTAS